MRHRLPTATVLLAARVAFAQTPAPQGYPAAPAAVPRLAIASAPGDRTGGLALEEALEAASAAHLQPRGWSVFRSVPAPADCQLDCLVARARGDNARLLLVTRIVAAEGASVVAHARLLETDHGRLLASAVLEGQTAGDLVAQFERSAPRFFKRLQANPRRQPVAVAAPANERLLAPSNAVPSPAPAKVAEGARPSAETPERFAVRAAFLTALPEAGLVVERRFGHFAVDLQGWMALRNRSAWTVQAGGLARLAKSGPGTYFGAALGLTQAKLVDEWSGWWIERTVPRLSLSGGYDLHLGRVTLRVGLQWLVTGRGVISAGTRSSVLAFELQAGPRF